MFKELRFTLDKIKKSKPVVLNLTNYVTQDFMANVLLAIGAAPIMSESIEEIPELITLASGININLGTLQQSFIQRIDTAVAIAKIENKPIVLDPVGSGATELRTQVSQKLLQKSNIIRGNASEIMSLHILEHKTLGVESLNRSEDAKDIAITLSNKYGVTIVVSGANDLIIAPHKIATLFFGSPLMQSVTGMGCSLNAVITAFASINPNYFQASKLATAYFNLCAEIAAHKSQVPGSFKVAFMDALYCPDWSFIQQRLDRENCE